MSYGCSEFFSDLLAFGVLKHSSNITTDLSENVFILVFRCRMNKNTFYSINTRVSHKYRLN